jgi:hypothetical protein
MRNLEGRDPRPVEDRTYIACLRRANLDAINARAKSTIKSHISFITTTMTNCERINKTPRFEQRGPFAMGDVVGMGEAVDLLTKSIFSKGRVNNYIQYDTMRKGRSTFTKLWESSPQGVVEGSTFSGTTARVRLTSCRTQSAWYLDFSLGAQDRMGYETNNQLAVPIDAVVRQLELIEADIEDASDEKSRHFLVKVGALIAILTAGSLRGHEGFYLDIAATQNHLQKGKEGRIPRNALKRKVFTEAEARTLPEVCICLLGKFKGETGERYHSIILANESTSGLKTRRWIERLMAVCEAEGRTHGSAFNEADGAPPSPTEYNAMVRHYFKALQEEPESLMGDKKEELIRYGISRTYRKTSETRARRAGMVKDDVETVNRWRKVERAKGKMPRFDMAEHYSDASQLGTLTWRYSYVL